MRLCRVRKLKIAEQTIFSMTLHTAEVSATGRKLPMMALEPPLWMGTMCASLSLVWDFPFVH